MLLPVSRRAELLIFVQLELVGSHVSVKSVNCEFIFKVHRKCFLLKWESYKQIFVRSIHKFVYELLQFVGLAFLDTLWHYNQLLHKRHLLNKFVFRFQSNHIQIFEGRISRWWMFHTCQKSRFKCFSSHIFVFSYNLGLCPVPKRIC